MESRYQPIENYGLIGQIEDYMPVDGAERARDKLTRRVRVVRGTMPFRMECRPAFDYARADHESHVLERLAVFHRGG